MSCFRKKFLALGAFFVCLMAASSPSTAIHDEWEAIDGDGCLLSSSSASSPSCSSQQGLSDLMREIREGVSQGVFNRESFLAFLVRELDHWQIVPDPSSFIALEKVLPYEMLLDHMVNDASVMMRTPCSTGELPFDVLDAARISLSPLVQDALFGDDNLSSYIYRYLGVLIKSAKDLGTDNLNELAKCVGYSPQDFFCLIDSYRRPPLLLTDCIVLPEASSRVANRLCDDGYWRAYEEIEDKKAIEETDFMATRLQIDKGLHLLPSNLRDLKKLTQLYLNKNAFKVLTRDNFIGVRNISLLELWNDSMFKDFRWADFSILSNLKKLTLRGSRLTLSPDSFQCLRFNRLESLNLAGNQITALPPGCFEVSSPNDGIINSFGNLTSLDLSGNKLTRLGAGSFKCLPELYELVLRDNNLKSLEPGWSEGLDQLGELDLSNNKLETMPPDSFSKLGELKWLDLGKNEFKNPEDGFFDGLENLEWLELKRNALTRDISKDFFKYLSTKKLKLINLHSNPGLAGMKAGDFEVEGDVRILCGETDYEKAVVR